MTTAYVNSDDGAQHGPAPVQRLPEDPGPSIRAAIYRRVASPGRVETKSSIAAQREACLRTAKELGFSLTDEHVDPNARPWDRPRRQVLGRRLAWFRGHRDAVSRPPIHRSPSAHDPANEYTSRSVQTAPKEVP